MAKTFEVTAPNGKVYEVTGPDDATEDQARAQAQQQAAAQPAQPKAVNITPTMRESIAEELKTRGPFDKFMAGAGAMSDELAMSAKQKLSNLPRFLAGAVAPPLGAAMDAADAAQPGGQGLAPEDIRRLQDNKALLAESGMATAGNMVAGMAATGAPSAAMYRGAMPLAQQVAGRFAPPIAAAVTGAATNTAASPVLPDETLAGNAAHGAAGAVVGDTAMRVASRIIQPILQTPAVQQLIKSGIIPTIGQAAGGAMNTIESKLTSLPLTGAVINWARNRPKAEFNRAELNLAMPDGKKVEKIGNEGFEQVKGDLSAAYDRMFVGKKVAPDQDLAQIVSDAKFSTNLPLNKAAEKDFDAIFKKVLWERIPTKNLQTVVPGTPGTAAAVPGQTASTPGQSFGGSVLEMDASKFKAEVIGDIGKEAAKLQRSTNSYDQRLGDALMNARNGIQDWLTASVAQANPKFAGELARLDAAYSQRMALKIMNQKSMARGGEFTPYQALRATRENTPGHKLAEAAQEVLGNSAPDSGTAGRYLLASLMGGNKAGLLAEGLTLPASLMLYSKLGQRYMTGGIPGQSRLADTLRSAAPYAANAGATSF